MYTVQDQHPRKRKHRFRLRNGQHKERKDPYHGKNTLWSTAKIFAWIFAVSNLHKWIQTNVQMRTG